MSGDLQVYFLVENYFNLGNPFFVMYTDIPEFYLISPTALIMNDLHLSSYMTDKGANDVKYFFRKNGKIGAVQLGKLNGVEKKIRHQIFF